VFFYTTSYRLYFYGFIIFVTINILYGYLLSSGIYVLIIVVEISASRQSKRNLVDIFTKHFSKTSSIDAPPKLTAVCNVYQKQILIIILVLHL